MTVNMVHAVLLLHSAGKEVSENNVSKVVEAVGEKADPAQVKSLVASLNGVNIDEAVKQAVVSAAPAASSAAPTEAKKEKAVEEKPKEEAVEGLAGLFG
jgi:large subunit ribosomal protein L12